MKKIKLMRWALGASLAVAAAMPAQATIMTTTTGITSPETLVDFETTNIANNTVITSQFSSSGVTFSGIGVPRYNSCGDGVWDSHASLSGDTLNTYGPTCVVNDTDDSFSILFDRVVSEASFGMYLYNGDGGSQFKALLSGVVQEVWSATAGSYSNQFLTFSDILFDEILYIEGPSTGYNYNYLVLDNLAFNNAVPAPAPLALLGLGLVGLMVSRSRRTAV